MLARPIHDHDVINENEKEVHHEPTNKFAFVVSVVVVVVIATSTTLTQYTMDMEERRTSQVNTESSTEFVPLLAEHGITKDDLEIAVRVLTAVSSLHPTSSYNKQRRKELSLKRKEQQQNCQKEEEEEEDDAEKEKVRQGVEDYKQAKLLRPFRKALAACLELHKLTMFQGRDEEEHYERKKLERTVKRQKTAERDMHKKYIASTALRKGRMERLQQLQQDGKDEETGKQQRLLMAQVMVPDGHVDTNGMVGNTTKRLLSCSPATNGEESDSKQQDTSPSTTQLPNLRSCYVCKVRYRDLHHFYDQLCPSCAALNWEKRHQQANLSNAVAVVTGSRVKIGYQVCLKLLRAGATVVATTRFPNAAVATYRQETDFDEWKDRLHVYGLDLRDVTGMEAFTRFLKMRYSERGIDILINNACQTVRRPVGYYTPIVEKELKLWKESDETHKMILADCSAFEHVRRKLDMDQRSDVRRPRLKSALQTKALLPSMSVETVEGDEEKDEESDNDKSALIVAKADTKQTPEIDEAVRVPFETTGLTHSAAMSQTILLPEDAGVSDSVLPPGVTDINGQQLDLRTTNSWLLKMEEVSTPEVMECMFVNAIAPFVLNSRLKPLMTIPHNESRPDRYIINVSAMEGKFYRYKMPNHPHTNMAKAALNMLTRTSAEDLAKHHRIFMNSVDTGWINDENPLERARKTAETNLFQTPIDEIDAAARIVDPIFTGVNGGKNEVKDYGKFLKDYRETEW